MKDKHLGLITLGFMLTTLPFLITCMINPDSFGNRDYNSLIFLGMGIVGLPATVISMYFIMERIAPDDPIQKESTK